MVTALLARRHPLQGDQAVLHVEADGSHFAQATFSIVLEELPKRGSNYFILAPAVDIK